MQAGRGVNVYAAVLFHGSHKTSDLATDISGLSFVRGPYHPSFPAMHGRMSGDQDAGCHCYILGTLASKSGIAEAQTELKKKVLHTLWEEVLRFPLTEEEMPGGTLTLTLRNCDKFSRHSIVGELKLNLAEMEESFGKAQWERLKSPEKVWTQSVSVVQKP